MSRFRPDKPFNQARVLHFPLVFSARVLHPALFLPSLKGQSAIGFIIGTDDIFSFNRHELKLAYWGVVAVNRFRAIDTASFNYCPDINFAFLYQLGNLRLTSGERLYSIASGAGFGIDRFCGWSESLWTIFKDSPLFFCPGNNPFFRTPEFISKPLDISHQAFVGIKLAFFHKKNHIKEKRRFKQISFHRH